MSGPIYGGNDDDPRAQLNSSDAGPKGYYANYPAATPKYNTANHLEVQETLARLYIEIPDPAAYSAYLDAVPAQARAYAEAMTQTMGSSGGKGYINFLLTSVQEPLREKVQVSEVLSDGFIAYYFGQSAPIWNYSIALLNTQQDEWYDAWNIVYENIIRGTRLAEANVEVTLAYDTRRVRGSIMQSTTSLNAQNETAVAGGFALLVREFQVAVNVTESLDIAEAQSTAQQGLVSALQVSEEFLQQTQTVTGPTLAAQRQRALDGSFVGELTLGLRSGYNSDEVESKTGIVPTNAATELQFNLNASVPLPPPDLT